MSTTQTVSGKELKGALLHGIRKLNEAVSSTLGPGGRTVLIKEDYGEVKISKDKTKIYFVCALKNVWGDFCSDLEVSTSCDFWQLYNEDIYVKKQYEINTERLKEPLFLNIPKLSNKYEQYQLYKLSKEIKYIYVFIYIYYLNF
jgi:hypothetical protein